MYFKVTQAHFWGPNVPSTAPSCEQCISTPETLNIPFWMDTLRGRKLHIKKLPTNSKRKKKSSQIQLTKPGRKKKKGSYTRERVWLKANKDKKNLHPQPRSDWQELRCAFHWGSEEQSMPDMSQLAHLHRTKGPSSGSSDTSTQEGVFR